MKDLFVKMMKKIYLTESQLNNLIKEDYIDQENDVSPYNSNKTYVTSPMTKRNANNPKFGKPLKTGSDKISKSMAHSRFSPTYAAGHKGPNYIQNLNGQDDMLDESNKDFSGKQNRMQISNDAIKGLNDRISQYSGNMNDAGIKRAKNMINNGDISYDNAYRILDDIENGKSGMIDPDGTLKSELERKLKAKEDISKNWKKSKQDRGESVIKSAPKTGLKGGAHTPKSGYNSNVIGTNWE